jgi:putative spermidine/putrescine transport system permease protein
VLLVLSGAVLMLWLVLPLLPLVLWSFARGWRFPGLLPGEWTLAAWQQALSPASGVPEGLGVTLLVAALATLLAVLAGVPAGRALGLYRFRGRTLVEMMILAPLIVPGIAVALGLHAVFLRLGLTNSLAGVVLVHLIPTLPYMTLVMAAVFAGHDPALRWQAFRHVTLPAILPGLVTGALFAFLVSCSQYVLTLMIGGGRVVTLPLILYAYAGAGRDDLAAATGLLSVLPGLLILVFTARFLSGSHPAVRGLGPG